MNKIEELTALVEAQNLRNRKAVIRTVVIYVILVILAIWYTSALMSSIKEAATPDAVSGMVMDKVEEYLPDAMAQIGNSAEPLAKMLADKSYDAINGVLEQSAERARTVIPAESKKLLERIKTEYSPKLLSFADSALDEILSKPEFDIATAGPQISAQVSGQLDANLSSIINDEFYASVNNLRTEIQKLSQPSSGLNRQQYSEKMCLVCWLYLSEHACEYESDDPVCKVVEAINGALESAGFDFHEQKVDEQ